MHSSILSSTITPTAGIFGTPQSRPISAKAAGKMRTPSWDGQSSFRQQQTPYARPPYSTRSSGSFPSTSTSPLAGSSHSGTSAKKASSASACIKNELQEKLSEFAWESESRTEKDDQHTHRYVACLNYAVRDKELDMQCQQLAAENANADLIHHRELVRMQKDIELKRAEESCIVRQVQMLQLQIRLEGMRKKDPPGPLDMPQL